MKAESLLLCWFSPSLGNHKSLLASAEHKADLEWMKGVVKVAEKKRTQKPASKGCPRCKIGKPRSRGHLWGMGGWQISKASITSKISGRLKLAGGDGCSCFPWAQRRFTWATRLPIDTLKVVRPSAGCSRTTLGWRSPAPSHADIYDSSTFDLNCHVGRQKRTTSW